MPMLRFDDAERAKKMCQDEWLNASVIPLQISARPLAKRGVRVVGAPQHL